MKQVILNKQCPAYGNRENGRKPVKIEAWFEKGLKLWHIEVENNLGETWDAVDAGGLAECKKILEKLGKMYNLPTPKFYR